MGTWETKKLTDLAEYLNGYAFAPDDWGTEGLPIIRIEQLKNPNAPADYYAGKLAEKNIIDDGDLIFSWSASLFLRIWQNGRAALNQHLFKVVEKPEVDRKFLKSFIEFYLPELTKASHGSTMQHITRKELGKRGFSEHYVDFRRASLNNRAVARSKGSKSAGFFAKFARLSSPQRTSGAPCL